MTTYLLAWNPKRCQWDDLAKTSDAVKAGETFITWSCGNSKRIQKGDRVFLIRLGEQPKGIFASGIVTIGSHEGLHWDDKKAAFGETCMFVKVCLDTLLDPESETILPRELLDEARFSGMHWDTQMSGVRVPEPVATELEKVWIEFTEGRGFTLPEEVDEQEVHYEGAVRRISVNAYERNPEARQKCLAHYGASCFICGFDFAKTYGEVGQGFIHVHHLRQLSEIGEKYEVDPIRDLRPVCPNCHAMIHRRKPAYSIDEIRALLEQADL